MIARTFKLYDTALTIAAPGSKRERCGGHEMAWNAPDYETFNRLMLALKGVGFTVGRDPTIDARYPSLGRHHRAGTRPTPHGDLHFHAEMYATGGKVEFFQEVVTVNHHGGRYDFDKRQKMPYLIGKAFDLAVAAARTHLLDRGFTEENKPASPVLDPLADFNAHWDSDYDRLAGRHRFERGEDGWPVPKELNNYGWRDGEPLIQQGSVWYFRDRGGRLARGRCYGGINGMWTVIYGPGLGDYICLSRHQLFQCSPAAEPRRVVPAKRGITRLEGELKRAVAAQDFERAITLRDSLRKAA